MFESLQRAIDATHSWLFSAAVQIALIYSPLRPLEAWTPAERWNDRHGVGIVYTALPRRGASPLAMFLLLTPIEDSVTNGLRSVGFTPWNLDVLRPAVTGVPIVSFVLHLIALDAVDYVVHRAQHPFRGWWALHALHHSQRKTPFWTDDRNQLLDSLFLDGIKAAVALQSGVEPVQFGALFIATRLLRSVQYANLPWRFWPLGDLLVSPRFHRTRHAIGIGHEGRRGGFNFAVIFPVRGPLFGTADFRRSVEPTGIRAQLPPPQGSSHDFGDGCWRAQWVGLKRMIDSAT